jgi:hypothetical protein
MVKRPPFGLPVETIVLAGGPHGGGLVFSSRTGRRTPSTDSGTVPDTGLADLNRAKTRFARLLGFKSCPS